MDYNKEVSVADFRDIVVKAGRFLRSKFSVFLIVGIFSAIIGVLYAWLTKPVYTAELTFAAESDKQGIGSYAGIAAQFGFDIGEGGGSVFEGENLMQLLKSRLLLEKALLSPAELNGVMKPLIYEYITSNKLDEEWKKNEHLKNISFSPDQASPVRNRDSILNEISKSILSRLVIDKVDKRNNITSVKYSDNDELFAKLFVEQLVNKVLEFYTEYKSKKSRQNVEILRRQADSVRRLLTGNIVDIAASSDLNINPLKQVSKTPIQRKQVDVQVNGKVYEEIVKQLELSKITMRKETPLVQIIDSPRLPLEKKKMGRLKGAFIFGFLGTIVTLIFLLLRRFMLPA